MNRILIPALAAILAVGAARAEDPPREGPELRLYGKAVSLSGQSIDGARVRYDGINGQGFGSVCDMPVVDGVYDCGAMQAGDYRRTVSGPGIITRVDERVDIGRDRMDVTALRWGEMLSDDVAYDERFDDFHNRMTRYDDSSSRWDLDALPPTGIHVVTDGFDQQTLDRVIGYAHEISARSNRYVCGPLEMPVTVGGNVSSHGLFVVRHVEDMNPNHFATAGRYRTGRQITGCDINLNGPHFRDNIFGNGEEFAALVHEADHCFGDDHTERPEDNGNDPFRDGTIMSNAKDLTGLDDASACVNYNHAEIGNKWQDTNPARGVVVAAGVSASSRKAASDRYDISCIYEVPVVE